MTVDSGPSGIRTNAVALGSIVTERYEAFLEGQDPAEAARIEGEMRRLHPTGRIGRPEEEAGTVAYPLSSEASFINGATMFVDGGSVRPLPGPRSTEPRNVRRRIID
jgi:NAD(P)-dependent dehydrogenase (short-subunit alcohol dehydrogenase family)